MQIKSYSKFTVYEFNDKYIFIHVDLGTDKLYSELLNYYFSEKKILSYFLNKTNITFDKTKADYASLYKGLANFFDEENKEVDLELLKKELSEYIDWEEYGDDELLKFRKDKAGKIGEYIFHHILNEYFNLSCVIPKITLGTSPNMSVYGIDVIFWDAENYMLLFGESKVSKSLDNGVSLINTSLGKYKKQIEHEHLMVLSKNLLPIELPDKLKVFINTAVSFEKFIELSDIKIIGIPIFIMHGSDLDITSIRNVLNKIDKIELWDLEIVYYIISIPIFDKNKFQSIAIDFFREKSDLYERNAE